jgi:hypothetical protein
MAYEGPEYWYVIYKAVADFGDLMRDARQAKQELQGMADQARAFNAEETAAEAKSSQIRQQQTQQLQQEAQALRLLGDSAKQTNQQLLYGGRNDMQQHLSDMDRLLQYTNLLNRAQWMNFSTVQQAMAYRQQMYQQKLLENRAEFGGYLTADQYLSYMAKRVQAANLDTAAVEARARAVQDETGAYLAYQNAITGSRQSIGQLGEGVSALGALNDAISALPDSVDVTLNLDDTRFLSELAADRQLLAAVPRGTTWSAQALPDRPSVQLARGSGFQRVSTPQDEADQAAALREEMNKLAAAAVRDSEAVDRMISRASEDMTGGNRYLAPETYRPGGALARSPGRQLETAASFNSTAARLGLEQWMQQLLAAVRQQYEFRAGLDDTEALIELDNLMARFRQGENEGLRLAAGMGGAAGGGGGGGPPGGGGAPPAPPPGPGGDGEDWRAEEEAARALEDELRRLTDASGGLSDAEREIGLSTAEAIRQLTAMSRAAAASGDAAGASRLAWAASTLQAAQLRAMGTAAEGDVEFFARLAAASEDAGDAARFAYAAQELVAQSLGNIRDPAAAAARALDDAGRSTLNLGRWMRILTHDVTLWSGVFGDNHLTGQVQLWHIALDGLIELFAVWVPALATAAAGLLAWGAAGYKAAREVALQMFNVHEVSTALNQAVPPLTQNFEKLQNSVRPQVYELLGDVLNGLSGNTGTFNTLIQQTGHYLDELAARIIVRMQSGGQALQNFFKVGESDLAGLGKAFDSLGTILLKLLQATAITHIAEDLLAVGDAILSVVADIFKITPTPVLVFLLAAHGIILWGGLAATAVGKVVIAVTQLTGKMEALNDTSATVARFLGATDEQLGRIASHSAGVKALADILGNKTTADEVGRLGATIEGTGVSIADFVRDAGPSSAARLEEFAAGLGASGEKAVALGIAAGATDGELASLAARLGGAAEAEGGAAAEGGGLLGMLGKLSPALGNVYVDIGLVAAALIGLGVWLGLRTNQTQAWIESVDKAVSAAPLLQSVGVTVGNLAAVTTELNRAQASGVGDATELGNAQKDLTDKLSTELDHTGQVAHAYGVSMPAALALMNTAGVTTNQLFSTQSKVWDVALQQVKGLVTGYQAMGQQLGLVGGDLNALTVSESSQLANMTKLNDAWDTWTKIIGGTPTDFIKFAQGLATMTGDAGAAGASMTGLSKNALSLQYDFQGTYTDVENLFDAFRSDQAISGQGNFVQFVKAAVANLIPFAGGSKEAAAQISALAQEAGGPATTNIATLQRWVGNISNPLKTMQTEANNAAIGASNLSQDAARLATTLQQQLEPAMSKATFGALGGQQVFSAFADDLLKFGPNSQQTISSGAKVAEMLLSVDKNSASAKSQFTAWAESMGMSKDQANKLWSEVSKGEKPLAGMRDQLAQTGTKLADLAKPGLWGQFEHAMMAAFDKLKSHPITAALFGALNFIPGFTAAMDAVGRFVTGFFGHTLPDLVTRTLPNLSKSVAAWFAGPFTSAVQGAWAHVWSGMVSPVVHVFDDVKHAITTGFDGWWKTHGSALEAIWGSTVKDLGFIWDSGSKYLTGSATRFGSLMAGIWRNASSNVTAIAKDMWRDIELTAQGFWGLFGPVIKSGWAVIEGVFKAAVSIIETAMKIGWDAMVSAAKIAWALIEAVIKIAWDAIVAIVSVALDLLTGHWHTAWTDISNFGKQVLNNLKSFFATSWGSIKTDTLQAWNAIKSGVTGIWSDIEGAARQIWSNLRQGFSNVVGSIKQTWSTLEGIFRGPVGYLVNTVYDNGIARLWNDVMGAIGGPKLPTLKFQSGGRLAEDGGHLNGYGGGDIVPALLEPGEAVVDKDRTRKYAHVLKAMGVPGFGGGGVVGDITNFLTGAAHDVGHILGQTVDLGKIGMALISGNTTALKNALEKLVGPGSATGELADMITGIPKTMITELMTKAKSLGTEALGAVGIGSAGGSATAGVETVARYIMAHGGTKEAGAGVGGTVAGESGGNPEILEGGGGGGAGLIQWTPESSAFPIQPIITGNVGRDMAVQLVDMLAYINSRGGIGAINAGGAAGGPMGAAEVYSRMEAPLVPGSDIRSDVVSQLYRQGLQSGGIVKMAAGGVTPSQYSADLTALSKAEDLEKSAFWAYHNAKLPASYTPGQKAGDRALQAILAAQQNTLATGLDRVLGSRSNPGSVTAGTWQDYIRAAENMRTWERTGTPPRSAWGPEANSYFANMEPGGWPKGTKAGQVQPSGWARWKSHEPLWAIAGDKMAALSAQAQKAYLAWSSAAKQPTGTDTGQSWAYWAGQLTPAKNAQANSLWGYVGAKRPKLTTSQWEGDYSDRLLLAWQQNNLAGAFDKVTAGVSDPMNMTSAEWTALEQAAATQQNWIYGGIPPRGDWSHETSGGPGLRASWPKGFKPGTYKPSGWAGWKYAHSPWATANSKASGLRSTVGSAFKAWSALYGAGGPLSSGVIFGGGSPGILVHPAGDSSVPSTGINLQPLVQGGPDAPVSTSGPSLSSTGMGFAGGGLVPGAGGGLGQMASMFGLGGVVGGELAGFGLPPQLQQQLAMTTTAQGAPRTVSAAAGDHIGVSVGSMTINNPLAEKPSESITRSSNRLALLAGR